MIFKNDLFISYANSDDEEDTRGERWVMRFQRDLSVALATRLGERPEVFFASETWRAPDRLSFVLQNARQSAVFLAILSPRYIASGGFVPRELVWFGSQRSAANIVAIELLPVQEETVLPLLRGASERGSGRV